MLLLGTSLVSLLVGALFAAAHPRPLAATNLLLCLTSVVVYVAPPPTPWLLWVDKGLAHLVGAWLLVHGAFAHRGIHLFVHLHLAGALAAVLWVKRTKKDGGTHALLHAVWIATVANSALAR